MPGIIRIPLGVDSFPTGVPLTPPTPAYEKDDPIKPYRNKGSNEQAPGAGSWRRFWDPSNKWGAPPPPRDRWTTRPLPIVETLNGRVEARSGQQGDSRPGAYVVVRKRYLGSDAAHAQATTITLYCHSGSATRRSCAWLRNNGFIVRWNRGVFHIEQGIDSQASIAIIALFGERGCAVSMYADAQARPNEPDATSRPYWSSREVVSPQRPRRPPGGLGGRREAPLRHRDRGGL